MIFGAHLILFSTDADADRTFLSTVLDLDSIDAGGGWLIFKLPPAEAAVHPDETPRAELYLMCDDLEADMQALADHGVTCAAVEEARWGSVTTFPLPGGARVGLYQPRHPMAIDTNS